MKLSHLWLQFVHDEGKEKTHLNLQNSTEKKKQQMSNLCLFKACYRWAQIFRHPKFQTYSDLRSNLIFTWYLADLMKCSEYLYFYFIYLGWLKIEISQNTSLAWLNTK
jgi:hypothetical protein